MPGNCEIASFSVARVYKPTTAVQYVVYPPKVFKRKAADPQNKEAGTK